MNNKAFTLTEILAVIVVLGLILMLATPTVLNRIKTHEDEITTLQKEMISESATLYLNHNKDKYQNGVYCISIKELIDNNYLNSDFEDVTGNEKLSEKYLKVVIQNNQYNYTIPSDCLKNE